MRSIGGLRLWPAVAGVFALRAAATALAFVAAAGPVWWFLPWYVAAMAGTAAAFVAGAVAVDRIPDLLPFGQWRTFGLWETIRGRESRPDDPWFSTDRVWRLHDDIVASLRTKDRKRYERCLRLAIDEGSPLAYQRLADLLAGAGRDGELTPVRERMLARGAPSHLDRIARDHEAAGRFAEALVFVRTALDRGLDRQAGLVTVARLHAALGDPDAATAAYREAVGLGPLDRLARSDLTALARLLYDTGRLDDAESVLRDLVASGPVDPSPLCVLLVERGRPDEAVAVAREHYERWKSPRLLAALHGLLVRLGRTAEAARYAPPRRSGLRDRPVTSSAGAPSAGTLSDPATPLTLATFDPGAGWCGDGGGGHSGGGWGGGDGGGTYGGGGDSGGGGWG